jgi:hypothetical protein
MRVLPVILVALLTLIVVASLVEAVRRPRSWPRMRNLGHWGRWEDY